MVLYEVSIEYSRLVNAETEDEAGNKFWLDWENECAEKNKKEEQDLSDSMNIKKVG